MSLSPGQAEGIAGNNSAGECGAEPVAIIHHQEGALTHKALIQPGKQYNDTQCDERPVPAFDFAKTLHSLGVLRRQTEAG